MVTEAAAALNFSHSWALQLQINPVQCKSPTHLCQLILAVSRAVRVDYQTFEEMMPTVLYGCVQVDLTTAEERLQEEVGALRCLQSSFF